MSEQELFNPKDFESFKFDIAIKNTTTRTEVKDGRRMFDSASHHLHRSEEYIVHFIEILEKGMVLELPLRSAARGHNIVLDLTLTGTKSPLTFHAAAKVDHVVALDNGKESVRLTLIQFDSAIWNRLKNIFSERQTEINQFLGSVKGH